MFGCSTVLPAAGELLLEQRLQLRAGQRLDDEIIAERLHREQSGHRSRCRRPRGRCSARTPPELVNAICAPEAARRGELGVGDEVAGVDLARRASLAGQRRRTGGRRPAPRRAAAAASVAIDERAGRRILGIGREGRLQRHRPRRADERLALDDDVVGAVASHAARRIDRQPDIADQRPILPALVSSSGRRPGARQLANISGMGVARNDQRRSPGRAARGSARCRRRDSGQLLSL